MSKFTAGKWEVDELNSGHYVVYTDADNCTVADCLNRKDSEANARLIAHAPEMYGYLVQVLNDYDLDPDLEGDIMWMLKDINGGEW